MRTRRYYRNLSTIHEAIIDFSDLCRERNLSIGLNHTNEALEAAKIGFMDDRISFQIALRSLFCQDQKEQEVFDSAFDEFWGNTNSHVENLTTSKIKSNLVKKTLGSVVMMGFGEADEEKNIDAKSVSGANATEVLSQTDFSKLSEIESKELDELAEKLFKQLNFRLKRRLKSEKNGIIDIRRTIRRNVKNGGNFLELVKKKRKKVKLRLIVLLDVSGSMDKYSYYLLKFIWSLKTNFKNIETFIFSTSLMRITDLIDVTQLHDAIEHLNTNVNNWSSGTKIGECLETFNQEYAKVLMNSRNMTIILSDGLDTGEPFLLASELKKINLRTKKLIWLNPLKGQNDYLPLAKGMKAALPEIDKFESAHNLDSLLELEKILKNVN